MFVEATVTAAPKLRPPTLLRILIKPMSDLLTHPATSCCHKLLLKEPNVCELTTENSVRRRAVSESHGPFLQITEGWELLFVLAFSWSTCWLREPQASSFVLQFNNETMHRRNNQVENMRIYWLNFYFGLNEHSGEFGFENWELFFSFFGFLFILFYYIWSAV